MGPLGAEDSRIVGKVTRVAALPVAHVKAEQHFRASAEATGSYKAVGCQTLPTNHQEARLSNISRDLHARSKEQKEHHYCFFEARFERQWMQNLKTA